MSLGTIATTSGLVLIFLPHHDLQTEQKAKESYKWVENPKAHPFFALHSVLPGISRETSQLLPGNARDSSSVIFCLDNRGTFTELRAESPVLSKAGMKARSLFGAGLGETSTSLTN
jgi:hypothetical protein